MVDVRTEEVKTYDGIITEARDLFKAKGHDYGDSWRHLRSTTLTDQILHKVIRIKNLEDMEIAGTKPKVAEGIEAELIDILNYAVLGVMKRREDKVKSEG